MDKSRQLPFSEKHGEISQSNIEKFCADDFVYLAYFAVFLREIKKNRVCHGCGETRKCVAFSLPGEYLADTAVSGT